MTLRGISMVAALALAAPGLALAAPPTPHLIVAGFYAPYLNRAEDAPAPKSAMDVIKPHADPALRAAIRREDDCLRRTHGICRLDADIFVAGQDSKLSGFTIQDGPATADGQVITAVFRNMERPTRVSFFFTGRGGASRIRDVEAHHCDSSGKSCSDWRLKATLLGR